MRAVWLRRARIIVSRFLGAFESIAPDKATGPDARVIAPFAVSYGRVVFCLYYPRPRPVAGSRDQSSTSQETPMGLHALPQIDRPVVGKPEELDRAA